jgi:hypothetical protein
MSDQHPTLPPNLPWVAPDGPVFSFPGPKVLRPVFADAPADVSRDDLDDAALILLFLDAVATHPTPVPWAEVLQAVQDVGLSEEWVKNVVIRANATGNLRGPFFGPGGGVLTIGPTYPTEQRQPVIDEIWRRLGRPG